MEGQDSLLTEEKMTSSPSPKRPRPNHTEASNRKKILDFSQPLTFPKPLSLQQNTSQMCEEKAPLQTTMNPDQQNFTNFSTDLPTQVPTHKVSITDITESDRFILKMLYDSYGAATISQECSWLGNSFQCVPPVASSTARGDMEEVRQVQNSSPHIQIVSLTCAEEDVRCRADCSYEEVTPDEDTDMQNGALALAEVSNQRDIQYEFSEKPLCCKKVEQVKNGLSFSHVADGESLTSKPQGCLSSVVAEVGEDNDTVEMQNVSYCTAETEEQFNEGRKQSFATEGEQTVGTIVENKSTFYTKDECDAMNEETEKALISKVVIERADDTTETEASVSIRQVITEGDNDAASFGVIDPAKTSGADRPADEKRNAGFDLYASDNVCNMDKNLYTGPLPYETVKLPEPEPTELLCFQSLQKCEYEKGCQSNTEAVTCIAHDKTSDRSDTENHWRPTSPCSSSSAIFDSAEDQRAGSQGTVGDQMKETNQSGSLDHPEAHKVHRLQRDMANVNEATEKDVTMRIKMGLKEVPLQQTTHEVTIESTPCKMNNESDCDSKVKDSAGLTDNQVTSCQVEEVMACNETAVEEDVTTAVVSNQLELNTTDIQVTVLDKPQLETCEIGDSEKNEGMSVTSECTNLEIAIEENGNMDKKNCTLNIVGSQGENPKIVVKSSQYNADLILAKSNNIFSGFFSLPDTVDPEINFASTNSDCTDHRSTAQHNCNDTYSPAPSVFPFTKRLPIAGFDTFEKIQLSPDDNDMDTSALGNGLLLASPPSQLLENPQHQLCHSKTHATSHESNKTEEIELFNVNKNEFLSNLNTCNKAPSPISAADVIAPGWPELKPHCESTYQLIYDCFHDDSNLDSSAVSFESDFFDCEGSNKRMFEMKTQFDTVLKELKLFFDISASDMASSNGTPSPEPMMDITEPLEAEVSKGKDQEEPDPREASLNDPVEDGSLECEGGDVGSGARSREGEQEVPLGSCQLQDAPTRNPAVETEQSQRMWSPSFMSLPLVEQLTQKLLEPHRRLEPLYTCTRPIRVGLSKRAKTRHLHYTYKP
ncbi:unnamed protein product [Knipowitschia caucasica]